VDLHDDNVVRVDVRAKSLCAAGSQVEVGAHRVLEIGLKLTAQGADRR